ncbi:hypothetical protein C0J52_15667 [Blattella germanica]|nr:hypothetical protein C0J52_15667 [Blattella germanica]
MHQCKKYASILLDIKSRSKAATSTPKQEAQEQETETPKIEETFEEASTPRKSSSAKKTRGNLVLLLKKLEENRAKYELRCKELSENKKRIEEKLQHFETQLDERDVYIKESQKVVEASQSPVLEAFDETQDLHAQVTHRDNVNMELKKKIVYLKTIVYDLQESFLEKDSVIAALTKAITLLSEDFSRRNKTAVDNLEETREEMRMMENTFVEKEVSLNNEMEELRKEIAAKNLRLHQLEENNKELQSVQFDLSTRNAELQEKVVRMLELTMQFQKQVAEQEEKLQHNEEAEKLKSQLDDAQKQMTKMKTQHKTKQLDALKKVRMLQLQFGTTPQSLKAPDQTSHLEEINSKLQTRLEEKEAQISDFHSVLSASSFETENLRTKIAESEYKLEELEKEVE